MGVLLSTKLREFIEKFFLCLVIGELLLTLSLISYVDATVGGLSPKIHIGSWEKISIALYLTFALTSLILPLLGLKSPNPAYLPTSTLIASILAAYSAVIIPLMLKLASFIGFLLAIVSSLLYLMSFWCSKEELRRFKFIITTTDIGAISIFSAITAILTAGVGAIFPSPTGGYTHIGDVGIFLAALLYGSKVGGLVGVIGPFIADILLGYPRWYVSLLAHGVEGVIAGLGKGRNAIIRAVYLAIAGLLMALTYFFVNVFIKGYAPALISFMRDLFGQAGISLVLAMIVYEPVSKALQKS